VELHQEAVLAAHAIAGDDLRQPLGELGDLRQLTRRRPHPDPRGEREAERRRVDVEPIPDDARVLEPREAVGDRGGGEVDAAGELGSRGSAEELLRSAPPHACFVVSAVFHYLGPAFAVLLFARVDVLGVAWMRVAAAAAVFAVWRRPWRIAGALGRDGRGLIAAWGAVLAAMNACFYVAIDRLPLATVAAIEFLPVVALAAFGARTPRNAAALVLAVPGVYLLTGVRLEGEPLGVALAFANAGLFALYIVLAHRAAQGHGISGVDALGAAMLIAAVVVTPLSGWAAVPALLDPVALLAGAGVGIASSVIPYVFDQLAMARLARATYALMVSLLPATAAVIGVIVLSQVPTVAEAAGVMLVIGGVALHRAPEPAPG
jgi:inner membrane transporter RhtA